MRIICVSIDRRIKLEKEIVNHHCTNLYTRTYTTHLSISMQQTPVYCTSVSHHQYAFTMLIWQLCDIIYGNQNRLQNDL